MIERPYVIASRIPFFLSSLARFKKKLTVIGIIGHTHGVRSAIKPPRIPRMNIFQREFSESVSPEPKEFSSSITGVQSPSRGESSVAATAVESLFIESVAASSAGVSSTFPSFSSRAFSLASLAVSMPLPEYLNSTAVGGMQLSSLHAPNSK